MLTLGAIVGKADRVISAADEETVTIGIILPTTTWDDQEGDLTTKGHSSLPSPDKADKPATFWLTGLENDIPGDWERKEQVIGADSHKGCPIMGSKLYPMGVPIAE